MKYWRDGITLLEVMVVLCLIALLVTLAMWNISFLDGITARVQADKLYALFFTMRQRAMTTNSEVVLKCDMRNNCLSCEGHSEKLSEQVQFGFFDGAKGPPGNPEKIVTSAVTFPSHEIHFYPTGIISSGTLYLIDKKKKHMYALSNAVSTVSYLRLYKYSHDMWKVCDNTLIEK